MYNDDSSTYARAMGEANTTLVTSALLSVRLSKEKRANGDVNRTAWGIFCMTLVLAWDGFVTGQGGCQHSPRRLVSREGRDWPGLDLVIRR